MGGARRDWDPTVPRRDLLPPGFEDHQGCSDWLLKFSTLPDSSIAYQERVLTRSDQG